MLFVAVRGRSWLFVAAHCWRRPFRVAPASSAEKDNSSRQFQDIENYLEV
jgi:hypothetical protein